MSAALEVVSLVLISAGCVFFVAGSVGMLRFPDIFTRLHASTKADNLGLGLVTAGVILQVGSLRMAVELVLIWGLLMLSGATSCHQIARAALRSGVRPWERP